MGRIEMAAWCSGRRPRPIAAALLVGLLFCSSPSDADDPWTKSEIAQLASRLTKLSRAVEGELLLDPTISKLASAALFEKAAARTPDLRDGFGNVDVNIRVVAEKWTSVLLCTKDRSQALLEDAGCTAEVDINLWESQPPAPCVFALDVAKVCRVP